MEWRRLRQCVDNGVRLPAVVESTNQNGLVVKLMGVDGFIPMRYIDKVTTDLDCAETWCSLTGGLLLLSQDCQPAGINESLLRISIALQTVELEDYIGQTVNVRLLEMTEVQPLTGAR